MKEAGAPKMLTTTGEKLVGLPCQPVLMSHPQVLGKLIQLRFTTEYQLCWSDL